MGVSALYYIIILLKRSRYSNRAVNNSNKAVTVFIQSSVVNYIVINIVQYAAIAIAISSRPFFFFFGLQLYHWAPIS